MLNWKLKLKNNNYSKIKLIEQLFSLKMNI